MEPILTAALGVCVAAVVGGAMRLLCPDGTMKRVYQVAVSAFFLCCLVTSVAAVEPESAARELDAVLSGYGWNSGEDLTNAFREQVVEQFERTVAASVEAALAELDVVADEVFVRAEDGDGGVTLEQITIRLDETLRSLDADVRLHVRGAVGLTPEVVYE